MDCKVYIETYGCTSNQADTDIMRGIIKRQFQLVDSCEESDVVVLNSCGVIEHTERKIIRRIVELKRKGKKIVLAGCLPRISGKINGSMVDSIIAPENLVDVGRAIKKVLNNERYINVERKKVDKSELVCLKERLKENVIAIVSISEGCLGACSYLSLIHI